MFVNAVTVLDCSRVIALAQKMPCAVCSHDRLGGLPSNSS